ncbi:class II fructose-bisphosphatase [Bartonella sp. TP]|uniref:class II fructose-bisphosphatase n=1 Tax=Bartonella sp. TP TaxID=3057550 RepID=UPI0025AFD879|nr:class II fructose-bisphosphatase [Bartonella sp. TP]MDN5248961.1 class II fructose-bisphosphatase [Alphaproteobacteria bacterium]WJW80242.1 class II fructose-bisphosphatase [Bartonella sp. TP]
MPMSIKTADGLDKNLILDIVEVAKQGAIGASKMRGCGDEKEADKYAVDAMRSALNKINMDGTIVIGEGERDEAPMLYIGEKVGTGHGQAIDIALDPLEGTTLCAKNQPNSLAVIAMAKKGNLLYAPDVYMQKIAVGPGYAKNIIDINAPLSDNIIKLAMAKAVHPQELTICIMDRPRHAALIKEARQTGARIRLITDGDIAAVIETASSDITGTDLYVGIGGAPEGVLASAAMRCLGGQIFGKLILDTEEKRNRAATMGITDPQKIYTVEEMAAGDVLFAATGVTNGNMLSGVKITKDYIKTETLLMQSSTRTIQTIKAKDYLS